MSIPLETQNFRASSYTGPYPRFPFGGSSCHWPDFSLFWRSRSAGFSPCPQLKPRRLWSKGLALEKKRVAQGGPGCFACGMRAPLVNLLSLMSGPRGAVVGCVATDRAARQRWPCIKDDTWWWGMGWWFANLDTVAAGIWTGHSTGMGVVGALCLLPPHSESWAPTHIYRGLRRGRRGKGWFGFSPPESLGLSWWRLRGEQGRKTGCTAMPAWTVAPGHPEDLLWQPGSRRPSLPWRKGSEGGWSRHPSSGQLLAAAERWGVLDLSSPGLDSSPCLAISWNSELQQVTLNYVQFNPFNTSWEPAMSRALT